MNNAGHVDFEFLEWLMSFKFYRENAIYDLFGLCVDGHNVFSAKWLYEEYDLEITEEMYSKFSNKCKVEQIDMARWLYSLEKFDYHTQKRFKLKDLI